ncbi:cell division protein SepF [Schaalia sp. ZJ1691]|uniref:cell division protein SepF n=1 Tax=Schaalia sp. ZJ1691 TaxID=2709404 RepID=UPI0013EA432E|nr:cell division protein SepF [Schaalia sp. ZJ1691]
MSNSFGARARKFMGWYSPEDEVEEFDSYDEVETVEQVGEVRPIERPFLRPIDTPEAESSRKTDLSRIVTVHPRTYPDAVTIGEAFREGTPVIINLSDMDEAEARRLVDFAAGLTFALHGVIERVTNRVFLLSPRSVEVSGDVSNSRRGSLFNQG